MKAIDSLVLQNLQVALGARTLLGPLDFELRAGECLAIVGESGAGKSLATQALLGLLPSTLVARGALHVDDRQIELGSSAHAALRGDVLAWIPQDPLAALHPLRRVGAQLLETLRHAGFGRETAQAEALALLQRVRLPDANAMLARYPHQLSGGQRQRICIALALATLPRFLIADEPTAALDPGVARGVLDLLDTLRQELDVGLLLVSHDLPLVAQVAQRVLVLRHGRCVESGETARVFSAPQAEYTRELLDADRLPPAPAPRLGGLLLDIDGIAVRYPRATRDAVQPTTLHLHRGECLALVGESGSGKSSLARALLRLLRGPQRGRIVFHEIGLDGVDIAALTPRALRPMRRRIGVVFQDPFASLDPRMTIAQLVCEPLRIHGIGDASSQRARAAELLHDVGLDTAAMDKGILDRHPHTFSGGQRQRIAIARALATEPDLLVCDEAVSALDAQHRAGILRLLGRLKAERGLALLFITHDLAAARALADRIAVMRDGAIVETGEIASVLAAPQHAYTRELLAARPTA
jgi:peptide/nickel transport system ATP-binding protein